MAKDQSRKPSSNPRGWPDHSDQTDIDERPSRIIKINQEQIFSFCSNTVTTAKYTWLNFSPLFLLQEFHYKRKMANLYFLLVACGETIPPISHTQGYPTTLMPLAFVVTVDAVFSILEDIQRKKADRKANAKKTLVFNKLLESFESKEWHEVKVGDVVKVENREQIPADLCILGCAEPDPEYPAGICYVETKSLDGETNLKIRQCPAPLLGAVKEDSDVARLQGSVEMEHPNKFIETFTGVLTIAEVKAEVETEGGGGSGGGTSGGSGGEEVSAAAAAAAEEGAAGGEGGCWGGDPAAAAAAAAVPLQPRHLLLRGCVLRSTPWAVGLVLNTGHDTKIVMSTNTPRTKSSSLELAVNRQIKWVVLFMVLTSLTGALGNGIWNTLYAKSHTYLGWDKSSTGKVQDFFVMLFFYLLLLSNLIPIALYVSMAVCKFFQSLFINQDLDMYHEKTDTPAQVRSFALNEELGQITHLFSDKTGTLTENIMEFKKCCVNGVAYGRGITDIGKAAMLERGEIIPQEDIIAEQKIKEAAIPHVAFYDDTLWQHLSASFRASEESSSIPQSCHTPINVKPSQGKCLRDFFRALAMCHTVIAEKVTDNEVLLSASSPDDEALVCAAAHFGWEFKNRKSGTAEIFCQETGTLEVYQVLEVLEFTSARKRMSVVVRGPGGRLRVLSKGADMVMENMLCPGQEDLWRKTQAHLTAFAAEGLRTLVVCQAELEDEKSYLEWQARFTEASTNIEEIALRNKGADNRIDALMAEIERDMVLLGCTAIEDKLQDGVGETISNLLEAGVKVWVLTGDKEETAINIGVACKLIETEEKMQRIVINQLNATSKHGIIEKLKHEIECFKGTLALDATVKMKARCLIIDGPALILGLEPDVKPLLLELACKCKTVVGCRVSPDQKREMVALVKNHLPKARTLAVGDGSNDVPMIQEAHVGVGISGQEGLQAVNSSDYAIAQFRFLRKLLLVHGRWNYRRMSKLTCYTFYKNLLPSMPNFFFGFVSAFSGQKYFFDIGTLFFNTFYTSLPIIFLGVYDQDISADFCLQHPSLYLVGVNDEYFMGRIFWVWMVSGLWESCMIGIIPLYAASHNWVSFWEAGVMIFTSAVFIANFKLLFHQYSWISFHFIIIFLSVNLWLLLGWLSNTIITELTFHHYNEFNHSISLANFWVCMVLVVTFALIRESFWKAYNRWFYPKPHHIVEEIDSFSLAAADAQLTKALDTPYDAEATQYHHNNERLGNDEFQLGEKKGIMAQNNDSSVIEPNKKVIVQQGTANINCSLLASTRARTPSSSGLGEQEHDHQKHPNKRSLGFLVPSRVMGFAFSYDSQSQHLESELLRRQSLSLKQSSRASVQKNRRPVDGKEAGRKGEPKTGGSSVSSRGVTSLEKELI